jgi:hypothetical protein
VQQLILLVLIMCWNPKSDIELTSYSIHLVFIICFSVCDNLWIVHNLSESIESLLFIFTKMMNFSFSLFSFADAIWNQETNNLKPICFLLSYVVYYLGTSIGLVVNAYFCFLIKMVMCLFIFISSSCTYATPVIVDTFLSIT